MFRQLVAILALLAPLVVSGCERIPDDHAIEGQQKDTSGPNLTEAQQAEQKAAAAQIEAARKAADTQAYLVRQRARYRTTMDPKIAALDAQIQHIEARAAHAHGKERVDLDTRLKKIHEDRATFADGYTEIDTTTPAGWDDTLVRLNAQWSELEQLVSGE
jgi:hypothetical protein